MVDQEGLVTIPYMGVGVGTACRLGDWAIVDVLERSTH